MLCAKYCPQICLCNPAAISWKRLTGDEMHFTSAREERELEKAPMHANSWEKDPTSASSGFKLEVSAALHGHYFVNIWGLITNVM